jgi:hypothetical protein
MLTIWKYELKIEKEQTIKVPKLADSLTVQIQKGQPVMWWLVDKSAPLIDVHVVMHWTGYDATDVNDGKYVNTFTMNDLVYHVFVK